MIRSGDTLGKIAAQNLGTSRRWPEIARANPGLKPNHLIVGARIALPCGPQLAQANGQGGGTAAGSPNTKPTSKPGAPLAGTGFLARLSGQKLPRPERQTGDAATATKTADPSQETGTPPKPQESVQQKPQTRSKTTKADPATQKPAAPAKPPAPPLPVWTARAGEDFEAVLKRWGKVAGYRVVSGTTDAWTLGVPVRLQAEFEAAVSQLVQGLGSDGSAPPVRIYSNRVVRVGGL